MSLTNSNNNTTTTLPQPLGPGTAKIAPVTPHRSLLPASLAPPPPVPRPSLTPPPPHLMPNLHHPVSLQDLEGEVAEDILHVYLHVLGLPQTEVRVCVAVVPREAAQVGPNKGAEKSVVPISVGLGWVGLGWVGLGEIGCVGVR